MNLIDLISHELTLINSDISTWKLKFQSNVHKNSSSVEAHNSTLYRGKAVRFYIKYGIIKENCDIVRLKIVFMQPDVANLYARDDLAAEIERKLTRPPSKTMTDIEVSARAILNVIKEINEETLMNKTLTN